MQHRQVDSGGRPRTCRYPLTSVKVLTIALVWCGVFGTRFLPRESQRCSRGIRVLFLVPTKVLVEQETGPYEASCTGAVPIMALTGRVIRPDERKGHQC